MPLIQPASPVDSGKLAVTVRGRDSRTGCPSLVEQQHGGALLSGGIKGHRGAGGRPPSAIREAARLAFSERLHVLTGIADGEDERSADRISAMKVLSDTGGVDKIALTVEEQPEQELTPERIKELWESLQTIKSIQTFEKLLVAAATKQQIEGVDA